MLKQSPNAENQCEKCVVALSILATHFSKGPPYFDCQWPLGTPRMLVMSLFWLRCSLLFSYGPLSFSTPWLNEPPLNSGSDVSNSPITRNHRVNDSWLLNFNSMGDRRAARCSGIKFSIFTKIYSKTTWIWQNTLIFPVATTFCHISRPGKFQTLHRTMYNIIDNENLPLTEKK